MLMGASVAKGMSYFCQNEYSVNAAAPDIRRVHGSASIWPIFFPNEPRQHLSLEFTAGDSSSDIILGALALHKNTSAS